MTNLVTLVREAVEDHPKRTAVAYGGAETTYADFWAMTGRFAGALRERGVGPGDRIAVYLPNLPQFLVAFHGILRVGAVVVPVNPQYGSREIRHILANSTAGAVITTTDRVPEIEEIHEHTLLQFIVTVDGPGEFSTGFSEFLAESPTVDYWSIADRQDDEIAVLPYTSGTTGDPKGVQLTHDNLRSNTRRMAELVPGGIGPNDVSLGALPLFHIYGMTVVMNATLANGATFLPMPEWDAGEAMETIREQEVTVLHGVPAMYNDLLHHPAAEEYDLSSVRLAGAGGSGMPSEVLEGVEDAFDIEIYEGYGLTETSPVTHFNQPDSGRRIGSIGQPIPGVDARVVDDEFEAIEPVDSGPIDESSENLSEVTGEIVVAGPNVMAGYHELPEANEAAFTTTDDRRWFHTGDIGYRDKDDFYYLIDRKSDVIVTGGYNVYPREVEELLYEHEAVADVAVVGVPDERRGETVKAFVVTAPGTEVSAQELREFCLKELAEYKHPRVVEFVEDLPRTTTGKVKKYRLREQSDAVAPADIDEIDIDTDAGDSPGRDSPQRTETADPIEEQSATNDQAATVKGATESVDADTDSGSTTDETTQESGGDEDTDSTVDETTMGLQDISGISEHRAKALQEAGFDSIVDIRRADRDELAAIEGFGDALVARIKRQVEESADSESS